MARYVVTGDADDLEGWTAKTLAFALQQPLGALGVEVECRANQSGGGGLKDNDDDNAEALEAEVTALVERIIDNEDVPKRQPRERRPPVWPIPPHKNTPRLWAPHRPSGAKGKRTKETSGLVAANEDDATPAPIRAVLAAVEDMRRGLTDPKERAKGIRALGRLECWIRDNMGKLAPASQVELAAAWKATARRPRPPRIVDDKGRVGITAQTREAIALANRLFAKARGPETRHRAKLAIRRAEDLLARDLGAKLPPLKFTGLSERVLRLMAEAEKGEAAHRLHLNDGCEVCEAEH